MSGTRVLRPGEVVPLSSLTRSGRRPDDLVVSVVGPGPVPDVVALLLGPDGRVSTDRDLVFFNQPVSPGGAVSVDPAAASARIRPGDVEGRVARILVGCAGEALEAGRPTSFRVDVSHPGEGLLASAVVDVPAHHRAETVLEVYRRDGDWRLRLLAEGYPTGLDGLVRDHGVQVDTPEPAPAAITAIRAPVPARATPPAAVWTPSPSQAPHPTPSPATAPRPTSRHAWRRPKVLLGAGAAALVAVVLGATFLGRDPEPTPRPVAAASSSSSSPSVSVAVTTLPAATVAVVPGAATTQAELALLPVKGRAPTTGYDRSQFGQAWADVDRNGCDTRNDVLRRDVAAAVIDPATHGCVVLSGDVADPYSGSTIPFVRAANSSAAVQIDHVVALGDAWQTGAQLLDATRRTQFANDPANLLAVDGSLNAQKGDGDAATWLPPNTAFRCTYVAMQVAVKRSYGLWVTAAEHDAIARVLAGCPGATAPPTPTVPSTSPVATPSISVAPPPAAITTAPAPPPPTDDPGSVYYANCTEARAAGVTPIYAGQPGYSRKLDRDGDGVACE